MHFTAITLLALVAGVVGLPPTPNSDLDMDMNSSDLDIESAGPCGALARKAVCCKKSLLGLVDFGCHRPKGDVQSGPQLAATCSAEGKVPRCCLLGLLGTYVACKAPQGVAVAELEDLDDTEDNMGVLTADQHSDV